MPLSEASFMLFQNTVMGIETIIYACFLTVFFYLHKENISSFSKSVVGRQKI